VTTPLVWSATWNTTHNSRSERALLSSELDGWPVSNARRRQDDVFGESAVYVARQVTGVHAQLVMARAAVAAGPARQNRLDAHPVPRGQRTDTRSDAIHDAADLVARRNGNERQIAPKAMQVAATDAAECDSNPRLARRRCRRGDILDLDRPRRAEYGGSHAVSLVARR